MQSNFNTAIAKPLRIGGWGFVTGGDISADNLRLVASMDVQVPYYKDSTDTEWHPLLTTASMATSEYDPAPDNYSPGLSDGSGSYAVCIAPSNKNIIYTSYNALLYRVDLTSGVPVATRLGLAAKRMLANSSASRLWNNKIAVHATNPNTVLVGTMGDGVYFTTNANLGASATFTQITDIAASGTNPHLVAIDPGNGNYAYVTKEGSVPYRISTGLAATGWTALTGGPINVSHMEVLSDGTLVCLDRVDGKLWKLARLSSTWSSYSTSSSLAGGSGCSFAINPSNLNQVVVCSLDGPFLQSADGGATWVGSDVWRGNYPPPIGLYMNATDIPALGNFPFGIYPAKLKFDTTGKLVMWHGTGVADSTPPSTFARWDWYDRTKGLEELGLTFMRSVAGNPRPIFGSYDKGLIRMIDLDRFTMKPIFTDGSGAANVQHCYQIGVASGDPTYITAAMGYGQPLLGRSKDGGKTWATFPAQHPDGAGVMYGGACCSTGINKMIFIPGNNNKAIYTLDDGTSWSYLNLPGAGTNGQGNWINSTFTKRHPIAADYERPGHALLVTRDDQIPATSVLKTIDHGVSWTVKQASRIETGDDSQQFWACHLDYIPGRAGELLYTVGPTFVNNHLCYSNTDGSSWTFLRATEIRDVWFFDFGPTLSGSSYPVVFIYCQVNGVRGLYVSLDFFATTPILLARFPLGLVSSLACLGADRNVQANGAVRCFVGFGSGGGAYIDYLDQANGT